MEFQGSVLYRGAAKVARAVALFRPRWTLRAQFLVIGIIASAIVVFGIYYKDIKETRVRRWLSKLPYERMGYPILPNPEAYKRYRDFDGTAWLAEGHGITGIEDTLCAILEHRRTIGELDKVVFAIGELGGERGVDALTYCLNDRDENLRDSAARALGCMADRRAIHALGTRAILTIPGDTEMVASLLRSLREIGGPAALNYRRAIQRSRLELLAEAIRRYAEFNGTVPVNRSGVFSLEPLWPDSRESVDPQAWSVAPNSGDIDSYIVNAATGTSVVLSPEPPLRVVVCDVMEFFHLGQVKPGVVSFLLTDDSVVSVEVSGDGFQELRDQMATGKFSVPASVEKAAD